MAFLIEWKKSTKKDLRKLPPAVVSRILEVVEGLAENPFGYGAEKLTGSEHTYRIKVGDYRVVYEVSGSTLVEIQRVRHRKDVHRT